MHPAEVVRLVLGDKTLEKVRDSPTCRSILALARGKRPGDEREKSPINEGVAVDKEQSRAVWNFHEVNIRRPRFSRSTGASIGKGILRLLELPIAAYGH